MIMDAFRLDFNTKKSRDVTRGLRYISGPSRLRLFAYLQVLPRTLRGTTRGTA